MRLLRACLLATVIAAPGAARGQALLQEYLARVTARKAAPSASELRRFEEQAAGRVDRRSHASELEKVERLADGRLLAVYTRSQLRPRALDRFTLFAASGQRLRELEPADAYRTVIRGMPYGELVGLWRRAVGEICTVDYARGARVRVQVETELRFLEAAIEQRARRTGAPLPWQEGFDARSALARIDPGGRAGALLGRTRIGENTLAMLGRGDYMVHPIRKLPQAEFRQLLRWGRADPEGFPYLAGVTMRDWPKLARKGSLLARAMAEDIDGIQFGGQRSAGISPGLSPREVAGVVAHELNHGANRIPAKDHYGKRETLAFELAAAVAARRALGQPVDQRALRQLKREIVESYGLGSLSPESVADRPHGPPDNWVPRFPRGEERRYLATYFARRR